MHTSRDDLSALARAYDAVRWEGTALGPRTTWSAALRNAVDLALDTRFPVMLMWGPDLTMVYNEAYVQLIADKHPAALGTPAREVFPEAWPVIGPLLESVMAGGGATWLEDEYVPLHRRGFLEECYFTFSYSPLRGPDGTPEGVMDIATETTEQVISSRRLRLLGELNERLAGIEQREELPAAAQAVLRAATRDVLAIDVRLHGVPSDHDERLPTITPDDAARGTEELVEHAAHLVVWLPLATAEASFLVVALNPELAADEVYLGFLRLVAATLRQALDRVRMRSAERRTAETQRSMSEAFQRSLLPEPRPAGSPAVAARYQPALELAQLGGDWYDFFELPDGSLTVVIGDVAGHDQQSAAAMAQVRNMTRGVAHTLHPAPPGRVLSALDRAMSGTSQTVLATAVLAQLGGDGGATMLRWSNAGHPPPVLIDTEGRTRLLETAPDLLLGLDDSLPRADNALALAPGSTVVLYTDGLIERRGAPLARGLDWLLEVLRDHHETDVEKLSDHVLTSAGAVEDDVALLVIRC
ncbi:MAG: SpoIIE family protein phosphatase [Nocardioides sp.]